MPPACPDRAAVPGRGPRFRRRRFRGRPLDRRHERAAPRCATRRRPRSPSMSHALVPGAQNADRFDHGHPSESLPSAPARCRRPRQRDARAGPSRGGSGWRVRGAPADRGPGRSPGPSSSRRHIRTGGVPAHDPLFHVKQATDTRPIAAWRGGAASTALRPAGTTPAVAVSARPRGRPRGDGVGRGRAELGIQSVHARSPQCGPQRRPPPYASCSATTSISPCASPGHGDRDARGGGAVYRDAPHQPQADLAAARAAGRHRRRPPASRAEDAG